MARRTGTISLRSDGRYQIRYDLGLDQLTGKRKRISLTIKGTRKDAERELRRVLKSIDDNQYVEPTRITLSQFLTQWLESMRSQVSLKTHERYDQVINSFLIPAFGVIPLAKLTPIDIQNAYNKWEVAGRRDNKEGGLSPRTRLHIHRVFKSALKQVAQLQLIGRNPAEAIKAPRVKRTTITTLTVEQSAVLLAALQGKAVYLPVMLALATGMRRGEILALRWKNVDLKNKTVRIVESLEQTKQGVRFKAPKTERTRAVILPDYAIEELSLWQQHQCKQLEELGEGITQDTLVCTGQDGKPQWPTTVTHQFGKAIRKLPSLPRIRFHDLRHSHATQLLAAGIHPKIAQERLGHSSITTTLDLYSHVTDTMQDDAASKLDGAFRMARKFNSYPKPTPQ